MVTAPTWDEMFIRLQAYKEKLDDYNVPFRWPENPALGPVWLR